MIQRTAPDIAVLMPIYNPANDLRACLDSLRAQTIPFRLFIVDDGSNHKPDYRALTAGMDVHIIELPKNLGITGALNAGLDAILKLPFKFVARVDYPDLSDPSRLEKQSAFLHQNPDYCMVGSAVHYHYTLTDRTVVANNPPSYEACATLLRYNAPLTHGAIMFQIEFLKRLIHYSELYPAAEDYAMEWQAFELGQKFCNLPELLYTTIEIQQSISVASRGKQLKSRLRLQWRYADWFSPHTYLGLLRTVILMWAPIDLVRRLKSAK